MWSDQDPGARCLWIPSHRERGRERESNKTSLTRPSFWRALVQVGHQWGGAQTQELFTGILLARLLKGGGRVPRLEITSMTLAEEKCVLSSACVWPMADRPLAAKRPIAHQPVALHWPVLEGLPCKQDIRGQGLWAGLLAPSQH